VRAGRSQCLRDTYCTVAVHSGTQCTDPRCPRLASCKWSHLVFVASRLQDPQPRPDGAPIARLSWVSNPRQHQLRRRLSTSAPFQVETIRRHWSCVVSRRGGFALPLIWTGCPARPSLDRVYQPGTRRGACYLQVFPLPTTSGCSPDVHHTRTPAWRSDTRVHPRVYPCFDG
jgi:hypothetical protein